MVQSECEKRNGCIYEATEKKERYIQLEQGKIDYNALRPTISWQNPQCSSLFYV